MKKLFFTLAAVFAVVTLSAQITSDLVIKRGVDIEPNGLEDDEVWSMIPPVEISNKFDGEEASVSAYFKMYYTDEFIYLLVNVTDDVFYPAYVAGDTKQEWLYDKAEIYFDVNDVLKDGNGPAYINGYMAPGHYQMAPFLLEENVGSPFFPDNVLYGSLSKQVAICYALKLDENFNCTGYITEYQYPMEAFKNDRDESLDLNAFKNLPQGLGFDVIIVDNDNDGMGRKRAVWKNVGPVEPYNDMDNCAVVAFSNDNVSSINNASVSRVNVFPTIAKDLVNVEGGYERAEIISVSGQSVKVATGGATINVSDLASGLYLVKIYEDGALKGVSKITKK